MTVVKMKILNWNFEILVQGYYWIYLFIWNKVNDGMDLDWFFFPFSSPVIFKSDWLTELNNVATWYYNFFFSISKLKSF